MVEMAVARATDLVEDERGFTTAGDDHKFDPEAADRVYTVRRRKWTLLGGRNRKRALKTLSMPVAPVELDLDETLKADKSFHSPEMSDEEESSSGTSRPSRSRSGSGERSRRTRIGGARDDSESESVGSPVSLQE